MKELKKITQAELNEVIEKHRKWLNDEEGAEKANLSYTDLGGVYLSNADLRFASFYYSDLSNAYLNMSNFYDCEFSYAVLKGSIFTNTNLSHANLSHADLSYADFSYANFENADLSYANLICCSFKNANLKNALMPIHCLHFVAHVYDSKHIRIGCKRKTIEEWDYFFNESDKEYETKRGTEEFKRIQANYLAMKAYIEFMQK